MTFEPGDPRYANAVEAAAARIKRFGWPYRENAAGVARVMAEAFLAALAVEGLTLTDTRRCEMCEGTRRIMVRFGGSLDSAVPCPSCGGTGRTETTP